MLYIFITIMQTAVKKLELMCRPHGKPAAANLAVQSRRTDGRTVHPE